MKTVLNDDQNTVKYVVRVNGAEVSPRYTTPQAADAALQLLSEEHRAIAEVVPVTSNGNELLLG